MKTDELKERMKEYKARRRLVNACTKFFKLKVGAPFESSTGKVED